MKISAFNFGLLALGGLIVTLIMRYGIASSVIKSEVMKKLKLEPGTDLWEVWSDIPIPIFTKFYFFNVSNPDRIINGDKPIVHEVGPYVYQEKRMKVILKHNEDEVSYRPRTTWFFRPDLSHGAEDDKITLLNIPFVGVAKMAWDLSKQSFILATLDEMLTEKGEKLFQTNLVKEYLFDGISIGNYMELLSMPVTQVFGKEVKISERLLDGDYGFFDDRNGTADEIWIVKTGKDKISDFGKIVSWDGKPRMDVWKDETCDTIQGTDGSIFPPFADKKRILNVFTPDMCRTLQLQYSHHSEYKMSPTMIFKLVPSTFGTLKDYPENKCYCKDTYGHCMKGGLIPVGACQQGAPLFVSRPHFIDAHQDYKDAVIGLDTELGTEDFESYIELDANIGQVIRADFKLQMNIELQSYDSMPTFENVPNVMFPLIWLEQSATLTDELHSPVKLLGILTKIMDICTTIAILVCICGMVWAAFWAKKGKKDDKLTVPGTCCFQIEKQ